MKGIAILSLVIAITSCSHFEYVSMYHADNAGTYKCEPTVQEVAFNNIERYKEMDMGEFEKHTGYNECSHSEVKDDYIVVECKKPTLYRRISSMKPAMCHKFMADNKVMITK